MECPSSLQMRAFGSHQKCCILMETELEVLKNKERDKVTTGTSHAILANNSVIKTDLDVLLFGDQECPIYAFIF